MTWCHDIARDAAVRASEDNRTGPLPTLGECIDGMFPKSVSASSAVEHENKGQSLREKGTKRDEQAAAYRAEVQSGLRTEREPPFSRRRAMADGAMKWCDGLEVPYLPVNIVTALFSLGLVALPSEAALPDVSDQDGDRVAIDWPGLAKVLQDERDAAIRERDALRASAITQSLTADRFASAVAEADTLRARVAELEFHVIGLRRDVKAAEREAERLRGQLESVADRAAAAETALDAQTSTEGEDSCDAPAASVGGWRILKVGEIVQAGDEMTNDMFLPWCDAAPCIGHEVVRGRLGFRRRVPAQAASGGGVIRDMVNIIRSDADADEKHAAMATLVEAVCPGWVLMQAASGGGEYTVTEGDCLSTVRDGGGRQMPKGSAPGLVAKQAASGNSQAILDGSQAASGGGVDPVLRDARLRDQSRTESYMASLDEASGGGEVEPVAWGVEIKGHTQALYLTKYWADRLAEEEKGTVVPLYAAPPQPRGWLTKEEREAVVFLIGGGRSQWRPRTIWEAKRNAAIDACRQLLARSSPPEVVLPRVYCHGGDGEQLVDIKDVRAALAAAGVAVKEVS